MGFARYDASFQPEVNRTYQLDRYSKRQYANQVVRYRENYALDRWSREFADRALSNASDQSESDFLRRDRLQELADELSGAEGAHVIYRNDSTEAIDKSIVLFGDSYADYRSHLLTSMFAETVREVHFIWSREIDHEYVRWVNPDIVISEASEGSMVNVPTDKGRVSQWADAQLSRLEKAVNDASTEGLMNEPCKIPGLRNRRTTLLGSENYQLEPPILVQQSEGSVHQELAMQSNVVSLVESDQCRVYFSGERCLLRSANGLKIMDYAVDEEREAYLMHQDFKPLPGKSFLLAPSAGAHCYYHWMLDILPMLGLLQRQGIALDSIDHFLVREITGQFQIETLERLGIDRSRIVETIGNQYLCCEILLYVEMHNAINLKMNRFVPLWLKHTFLGAPTKKPKVEQHESDSQAVSATNKPLRLYIGRPEGVRRGLLNEAEIKPIIEAAGFTMVVMEGMSVAEQVELLSRADALMAPHGGALTNMVFCRPGIPVIEILSRHVYPYYYGLASMCGHRYHAILQDPEADLDRLVNFRIAQSFADPELQWRTQNESFHVDPAAVEAMMARLPSLS